MRYTAQNEAEIQINKITNDVTKHLKDLVKNKPKSHISVLLSQNDQLLLLLESGFSPHLHPP